MNYSLSIAKESCGLQYLPLLSPTIRRDQPCEVNHSLFDKRVLVAFATGVAFFLAAAYVPMLTLACGITGVVVWLSPVLDYYLTNRALDWNAAVSFHKDVVPSRESRMRLISSSRAINYLISMKADLNKRDAGGQKLLENVKADRSSDRNLVGLLCKNGYDYKDQPQVVKILLEKSKLNSNSFSPAQQFDLWVNANSVQTLQSLKNQGFDPNAIDPRTDLTVIEEVVRQQFENPFGRIRKLDYETHCRMLVEFGAKGQSLVESKRGEPIPLCTFSSEQYFTSQQLDFIEYLLSKEIIKGGEISEDGKAQLLAKCPAAARLQRIIPHLGETRIAMNAPTANGRTRLENAYIRLAKKGLKSGFEDEVNVVRSLHDAGAVIPVEKLRKIFPANLLCHMYYVPHLPETLILLAEQGLKASEYAPDEQYRILDALLGGNPILNPEKTMIAIREFGLDVNLRCPRSNQTLLQQWGLNIRDRVETLPETVEKSLRILLEFGADLTEEIEDPYTYRRSLFGGASTVEIKTIEEICPAIAELRREIELAKTGS